MYCVGLLKFGAGCPCTLTPFYGVAGLVLFPKNGSFSEMKVFGSLF
jgi:hypothetical protein